MTKPDALIERAVELATLVAFDNRIELHRRSAAPAETLSDVEHLYKDIMRIAIVAFLREMTKAYSGEASYAMSATADLVERGEG